MKSRPPGRKDNNCKGQEPRESRAPLGLQKQPAVNDRVHGKPGLDHDMSVKQGKERQMVNKQENSRL